MDNKPKTRAVTISNNDWDWLKGKAAEQDRSISAYIRQLIKKERVGNGNERV